MSEVDDDLKGLIEETIRGLPWYNTVSARDLSSDLAPAIMQKFYVVWRDDRPIVELMVKAFEFYERKGAVPFVSCMVCEAEMGDNCVSSISGREMVNPHGERTRLGMLTVIAKVLTGKLTVTET